MFKKAASLLFLLCVYPLARLEAVEEFTQEEIKELQTLLTQCKKKYDAMILHRSFSWMLEGTIAQDLKKITIEIEKTKGKNPKKKVPDTLKNSFKQVITGLDEQNEGLSTLFLKKHWDFLINTSSYSNVNFTYAWKVLEYLALANPEEVSQKLLGTLQEKFTPIAHADPILDHVNTLNECMSIDLLQQLVSLPSKEPDKETQEKYNALRQQIHNKLVEWLNALRQGRFDLYTPDIARKALERTILQRIKSTQCPISAYSLLPIVQQLGTPQKTVQEWNQQLSGRFTNEGFQAPIPIIELKPAFFTGKKAVLAGAGLIISLIILHQIRKTAWWQRMRERLHTWWGKKTKEKPSSPAFASQKEDF